jgi:uncharacterized DUF497 family protein
MSLRFEWDPNKASENEAKHGVSFPEAATVLADPLSLTIEDPDHSQAEDRWLTIGLSFRGRLLVVWHTAGGDVIRIIGARGATPRERRHYEQS